MNDASRPDEIAALLGGPMLTSLRILHATPSYAPAYRIGGPVQSLEGLNRRLRELDTDIRVLTTNSHGRERLDVSDGWTEWGGLPVRYLRRWARPDFTPMYAATALAEARRADVVHVTGVFNASSVQALAAAELARKPAVLSPRGALEAGSLRRGPARAKAAWLRLFGPLFRSVSAFHATSDKEADSIWAIFPDARVFVVPNGVEPDAYSLAAHAEGGVARLGALGRVHPQKGYERLIRAAAELYRRGRKFEVAIAGPTQDGEHLRALQEVAASLGIENRVRFVGEVRGSDKAAFLASCRVLALPSDETENFGNVVIEALASSVPVVASNLAPWSELVTERCGAWSALDPVALADAIEPYVVDAEHARSHGRAGRALVERKYSWRTVAQRMRDVYSALAVRSQT